MSYVTNTILVCFQGEEREEEFLAKVNEFFGDMPGFKWIDDPSFPRRWYGGTKALECDVYIGAFNGLIVEDLIAHLKTIRFDLCNEMQLIVKGQDDEKFRLIDIVREVKD